MGDKGVYASSFICLDLGHAAQGIIGEDVIEVFPLNSLQAVQVVVYIALADGAGIVCYSGDPA
jgi:hypothetical protein